MDNLAEREVRLQTRHHLVLHQVLHLEGYARQRDDHLAAPLEPHAGGRAVGVEEHRAALGYERLAAVEFVEVDAARLEHPPDVLLDRRVDNQPTVEHLGEGLLRDVVLRGAEAARENHDVGLGEAALERFDDLPAVVAYRALLVHDDTRRVEVFGNGYRIGVHNLADENLIADGQDGGLHGWKL